MNNKGTQESKSKFENLELILSDLHRQDNEIEDEEHIEAENSIATDKNGRKRHMDLDKQEIPKKKRFCWDDSLHYRFLEFIFKYGLENISSSKVHEMLLSMSVDIPFSFVDSYVQELRMNMSKSLDDFSQSYKEAMQYQETCAVEGNSGRFSVYPFPPPTIESHSKGNSLQPVIPTPSLQSKPPVIAMKYPSIQPNPSSLHMKQPTPSPSSSYYYPPLMPTPRTMNIPVLQSRNSLTIPRDGDDSLPFLLNTNMEATDQIMDNQIQLQQDMLYQNDYMLSRNRDDDMASTTSHYGSDLPLTFPQDSSTSFFPISSVLSAPTDYYLQSVDNLLDTNNLEEPPSKTNDSLPDIFDFLN